MNLTRIDFFILLFIAIISNDLIPKELKVNSPNKDIVVEISLNNHISYSIKYKQVPIITPSDISLTIDDKVLGKNPLLKDIFETSVDEEIIPIIKEHRAVIKNKYNQLKLIFNDNYEVHFRVFDDGFAYRFVTLFDKKIKVNNEKALFNFAGDYNMYIPFLSCREDVDCFHTSFEENYSYMKLSELPEDKIAFLPSLVEAGMGIRIGITEANLYDYPGMFIKSGDKNSNTLEGIFAAYPLEEKIFGGEFKQSLVVKRADYLAITNGTREFPWRILILTENDSQLLDNDIVYKLSDPAEQDFSWVKPGKSTEEWITSRNIYNVDFKSGINTDTYKYYIDFASKFKLEYVMLDAGWSFDNDLLKVVPQLDMQEILSYAKEKDVGIILWCLSLSLKNQMNEAFDQFERWGVKGIMSDFMDRDDQVMVNFYEEVLKEAAKRKMFVNFHGAFKPTGLRRKYPNAITREGVLGHEFNMWSDRVTPDHILTIPFIRMLAGPMDYEGGSMLNAQKKDFRAVFEKPMNQGTRTQQLAQYVVYISPLQYLAGNISDYIREPEFTELLAGIPTSWDDTKVIDAKISDYLIIARRHQEDWYVASMTDWDKRSFEIDFSFLDEGLYEATICKDGINAEKYAGDFKIEKLKISKKDKIKIDMAPGGGWVAILKKS